MFHNRLPHFNLEIASNYPNPPYVTSDEDEKPWEEGCAE